MPSNGSGLTITNPLVLYRSLVATNRITPDPSQHRLALHLQKLYENLKDYEPSVEYSQRLQQISRTISATSGAHNAESNEGSIGTRGIWTSLLAQKQKRDSLALTRVLTSHEAAMNLTSPKGLMLHGEVGTGKSMLVDLFADCLPNSKKKRWHFNTFMLETFSRLEALRMSRTAASGGVQGDEHSLLLLARDLIQTSPILFLDEFQLPDRAASKILSNLMTSFFQLGGVLIATSNRMPEELAKAAGMEFMRPTSTLGRLGWNLGLSSVVRRDDGPGQKGEFAQFLDVLRSRCEIWEMEGNKDYRRISGEEDGIISHSSSLVTPNVLPSPVTGALQFVQSQEHASAPDTTGNTAASLPKYYLVNPGSPVSAPTQSVDALLSFATSTPAGSAIPWSPSTLSVYGRTILIPRQYAGVTQFSFGELCGATLGPADYITLASTYHTLILTDIPLLTILQKNEARRLITLLDALYEARCRLLITAAAGPDDIFFPEPAKSSGQAQDGEEERVDDAVYPETYSEIHQDLTSPFRPNISSYSPSLAADALEDDPPNRFRRPGSSFTDERRLTTEEAKAPDFGNIGGLTGEDELFAVKRARSRIWEMCSNKWWARDREGTVREENKGWWRPLPIESRHWESVDVADNASISASLPISSKNSFSGDVRGLDNTAADDEGIFAHGASPFRVSSEPPPKIQWTHVWGTTKWGKRAGAWGKGVEGLEERKREKGSLDETASVHDRKSS